jgi:transposase
MDGSAAADRTLSAQTSGSAPYAGETITVSRQDHIQLVCEAQYWKSRHQYALRRIEQLEIGHRRELHRQSERAAQREEALLRDVEHARGRIRDLEQRLFGRKSERRWTVEDNFSAPRERLQARGQRRGVRGHGRRSVDALGICEEIVELATPCCPACGKTLEDFPGTEDSEVLEIEVKAYRRLIRRKRYRPECACGTLPGIVTAPAPARLIERGKFGISVWVDALLDKFLYGRASYRWMQAMADRGLPVSAGSLSGGLQAIAPLFEPLYQALLPRLRAEPHWHADETRWEVFVDKEGKAGHRWYLWVFQSRSVMYYVLDASRSSAVPASVLEGVASGLISCDRHSAYKKYARLHPGMVLSFCWAHQRRDFLNLANDHPPLKEWALGWVEQIGELFDLYERRCGEEAHSAAYRVQDRALRTVLRRLARKRRLALKDVALAAPAVKVLDSMHRHWRGLTEFAKHRTVPPDNNAAERALRLAVVGRKNFYGSGSEWSGELATMMFSLLMTMKRWQINPRTWLSEYLHACAAAGNRAPADLRDYLPWTMDEARLAHLRRAPCENAPILHRPGADTS